MITLMAMRKRLLLALLATGAYYGLAVSVIYSQAHAQEGTQQELQLRMPAKANRYAR